MRVGNELGGGNGKGAAFTTKVSVVTSTVIGFVFFPISHGPNIMLTNILSTTFGGVTLN